MMMIYIHDNKFWVYFFNKRIWFIIVVKERRGEESIWNESEEENEKVKKKTGKRETNWLWENFLFYFSRPTNI